MKIEALNEKKDFIDTVLCELEDVKEISLTKYNRFLEIKNFISGFENTEDIALNVVVEKMRKSIEKIDEIIKGKKEFEFISNYFINENKPIRKNDEIKKYQEGTEINEDLIKKIASIKSSDSKKLVDLIPLLSSQFLRSKMNLSDDEIKLIKGDLDVGKEEEAIPGPRKAKKSASMPGPKPKIKKSQSVQSSAEDISKEMEEEIKSQILRYTKSMKQNALNFQDQLKKDNVTLSKIEDKQNIDHEKTISQTKRLKEFNYSLSIGFFKLILMFVSVLVTFIFTLLIMRIFPKLA